MSKKKANPPSPKTWRPTPADEKILQELSSKLGVSQPDILRLGLRALAAKEGAAA